MLHVDISIIILTKNAGVNFRKLMEKIRNQTRQDFEVIVIDSGSEDETIDIAEIYGCNVHRIKPEDFHHSKTRNLGGRLARGDYLVYLTQDALPLNNTFLETIVQPMEGEDNVAGVYGRQTPYPDAKPMEKFFYSYFYPDKRRVITPADLENLAEFYVSHVYISNVCSAIRKKVWEKIKFDESIIMAEDKKWAINVLKAGYKLVYEPEAMVYHSHNYSIISAFKRRFDDGVAMKQICGSGSVTLKGFSYTIREVRYLLKNHKIWIPYAIAYNLARFIGVALGMHYEYIPNVLRRRISKHKGWWIQNE